MFANRGYAYISINICQFDCDGKINQFSQGIYYRCSVRSNLMDIFLCYCAKNSKLTRPSPLNSHWSYPKMFIQFCIHDK